MVLIGHVVGESRGWIWTDATSTGLDRLGCLYEINIQQEEMAYACVRSRDSQEMPRRASRQPQCLLSIYPKCLSQATELVYLLTPDDRLNVSHSGCCPSQLLLSPS